METLRLTMNSARLAPIIDLPEALYDREVDVIVMPTQSSVDNDGQDVKMFLASRLYAEAKLSSGQAAQLVGISKREFIKNVGKYGVSVFGQTTIEEVLSDMENASRINR